MDLFYNPYFDGIATLIAFFLLYAFITGRWSPLAIVLGADGRPSTSKTQFFLWTVMVIFSYVTLSIARGFHGYFDPVNNIPQNILITMGMSIGTAVSAKAITVSYLDSGKISKTHASTDKMVAGLSAILMDDDGDIDLSKIQMMAWTLIAMAVYGARVIHLVNNASFTDPKLPDIDGALMVLMGLGQGAYVGQKLVTTNSAKITSLSVTHAAPGASINIMGQLFGPTQQGNTILIDGTMVPITIIAWSDSQITFTIPIRHPDGTVLPVPGSGCSRQVAISVVIDGDESNRWNLLIP
ncbi:MAG TPA: IPT/TIG domain-containing protein [Phycisphaerae bacterium]|nr:IPT/TIG domain-containing protein [Phycisphaerae bacterium]